MKKKILLMTVALLCAVMQSTWADEGTWMDKGIRAEAFSSIDEDNKTISIANAAELGLLAYNISGNNDYKGYTITLTNDLDMSAHRWDAVSGTFKGTFDGQYKTISGLNYSNDSKGDAGLIVHNDGIIKDVQLVNSVIIGNRYVGAIAGENTGTVENCYVGADVKVLASNADDTSTSCGGIVGFQIQNPFDIETQPMTSGCYSEASIKGYKDLGGIIGYFKNGTMQNCVSKATISCETTDGKKGMLAGLVVEGATFGNNYYVAEAKEESANGTRLISVQLSDELLADGLNQLIYDGTIEKWYGAYHLKFYSSQIAIDDDWYAIEGNAFTFKLESASDLVQFKYVMVNSNELTTTDGVYTFDANDGAAKYIVDAATWSNDGSEEFPFLIKSTNDWNTICRILNKSKSDEVFSGKYFRQTEDIDINQGIGVTGENSSKAFCGTYDGDGHRLNCTLTSPLSGSTEAVAPFYKVNGATIKNLYVTGTITGGIHAAGLVAFVNGTVAIDNCRVSADIACTGNSENSAHGGGLVGHAQESTITVKNCLFDGILRATANDNDDTRLGAIIGWAGATTKVESCMEKGTYNTDGQTAFCWKNHDDASISDPSNNRYLTDFSKVYGADKLYTVTSGTEGLKIVFPDDCYDWQKAYHGAMSKSLDYLAVAYLIDNQFYTVQNSLIRFDVAYPENWKNVEVYNGESKLSKTSSGHYSFYQGTKNTVITATYANVCWTDEGRYATEFTSVNGSTITITSEAELARLAYLVQNESDTQGNYGKGMTFLLGDDFDMSTYRWMPIGNNARRFQGTFDGQGHTISGIDVYINNDSYVGFFGNIASATVKNLKLTNSQIVLEDWSGYLGGITGGASSSTIENCYVGSDVILKAEKEDIHCGGISSRLYSGSTIKGCYSAAKIIKSDDASYKYVGGIVGLTGNSTITMNVSQAVIDQGTFTSENELRGYVIGKLDYDVNASHNYYLANETSNHGNDVKAFAVALSTDEELSTLGYTLDCSEGATSFTCSGLDFIATDDCSQFQLNGQWYGTEGKNFRFTVPATSCGATLEDVMVNDSPATAADGFFYFPATAKAIITGTPLLTLSNTADNSAMLQQFNGHEVNVILDGRTFTKDGTQTKDGTWHTICLPFNLNISGSVLSGAIAKTLNSSSFKNGTLTLGFGGNASALGAGMPYIIKWQNEGDDIVNPKFTGVTIINETEPIVTDNVDFVGSFSPTTLTADNRSVLYMGNENKLYYPTTDVTVGSCRGYFMLKGLEVGDLTNARSIVLDFGDGEATAISEIVNSKSSNRESGWYDMQGRRLSGVPTTPGLYINNGIKVVIK